VSANVCHQAPRSAERTKALHRRRKRKWKRRLFSSKKKKETTQVGKDAHRLEKAHNTSKCSKCERDNTGDGSASGIPSNRIRRSSGRRSRTHPHRSRRSSGGPRASNSAIRSSSFLLNCSTTACNNFLSCCSILTFRSSESRRSC